MTARQPYHRIPIKDVVVETTEAVSLVLAVPPDLEAAFAYRPGQFLTVRVPHGNGSVARCYSLSSTPGIDEHLKITVKRVVDGYASNWICDTVEAGAVLEVLPPAGLFTPSTVDGDLLLLAGGSGITPVMSILKAALARGTGHLALVYANRDAGSVIFGAELQRLESRHPDRLRVLHWFDAAQGPPTVAGLDPLLRLYADRDVFICGPEAFLAVAREALAGLSVPTRRIHVEKFSSLLDNPFDEPVATEAGEPVPAEAGEPKHTAVVTIDGQTHTLPWAPNRRLLDVIVEAGLNPPFSCRQGICGACTTRLLDGEVELVNNEVLEEEDFADGYTLACQALPVTDTVTVTYE
jgi:3-ketosteroid 9alpha-monooxygenase subunit B